MPQKKRRKSSTAKKWRLVGWDTFSSEEYTLTEHKSQAEAEQAAAERMQELERTQPSISSGGQGIFGIQDRVYIERPDGTRYQWFTTSGTLAALAEDPAVLRGMKAQVHAALNDIDGIRNRADALRKDIEKRLKRKKK